MRRRGSLRTKALALLAVVCGAASFALVRGYAAKLEALRPAVGAPVPVVVAAQALTRGTTLSSGDVRIEQVPSAFAPPGAIRSLEGSVGRTLVSDLAQGEAVTQTRVGVRGGPVASLVPPGLRAFPVPAGIPSGTVRAGDRVDVLATFGGPHPHAETVATGLEVLTVLEPGQDGTVFGATAEAGPTLVLLVDPETAERLAYATAFADVAVTVAPADEVSS
jgi:Flp pilus assembly protein CpaB